MENPQVDPTTCPKCGATGTNPCLTPSGRLAKGPHTGRPVPGQVEKLPDEIVAVEVELNDPKVEKAAKAKARREKKVVAKRGKLPELEEIHRGEQIINPAKSAARRARKAARRNKARSAEWAAARGAELARAQAKAARKRLRDPETIARAQRRVERREAGIAARAKAASS
jgi:hypothetical protein